MPSLIYQSPLAGAKYPTIDKFDSRAVRLERQWAVQPRPYVNPLPYSFFKRVGIGASTSYSDAYCEQYAFGNKTFNGDPMGTATNRALDRLRDKLGDQAQLAAAIAEYRDAFNMIADRAIQLYQAIKQLKKGNVTKAGVLLRINTKRHLKPDPTFRPKESVKDSGQAWLEYWLGWSPLIGDINSAVGIITGELSSPGRITGSGQSHGTQTNTYAPPWGGRRVWTSTVHCRCRVQAHFTISNANRVVAQQLGLTDALSTAWELVPFSFIVNWLVNVDAYLGQFSWWDGYSITGAHQTRSWEGTDLYEEYSSSGTYIPHRATRVFRVQRSLGLPSITLRAVIPDRLSLTRAATATSLLVQQLR